MGWLSIPLLIGAILAVAWFVWWFEGDDDDRGGG